MVDSTFICIKNQINNFFSEKQPNRFYRIIFVCVKYFKTLGDITEFPRLCNLFLNSPQVDYSTLSKSLQTSGNSEGGHMTKY